MEQITLDAQQLMKRIFESEASLLDGQPNYRFIDNGADILAVAHIDTVNHVPTFSKAVLEGDRVYFSPAMDDRLGVYTILDVLPKYGLKYDVLLCTDEERGMSTAQLFVPPEGKTYKWMFEFDRMGMGAVYYQYEGTEIVEASKPYFKHEVGSFSDISLLDELGCAGINVGTGYYSEHTYLCHMVVKDWQDQVARFIRFYRKHQNSTFPYTYVDGRGRKTYYGGYYQDYEDDGRWGSSKDMNFVLHMDNPALVDLASWYWTLPQADRMSLQDAWGKAGWKPYLIQEYIQENWTTIRAKFLFREDVPLLPLSNESPDTGVLDEKEWNIELEEWDGYKDAREDYRIDDAHTLCDVCGERLAEFDFGNEIICAACDDKLYWQNIYKRRQL